MRRPNRGLATLVGALVAACAPEGPDAARTATEQAGGTCTLAEVERWVLEDPAGHQLYVEPSTASPVDGGFFLAGHPTYAWTVDAAGRGTLASDRAFLGVEVRGGDVRVVRAPRSVLYVGGVRSVRLGERSLGLLIEEVDRPELADQVPIGVTWAVYADGAWSDVDELPIPTMGTVDFMSAGPPVVGGDGLVDWAAPYRRVEGGIDVLHFEELAGGWRSSIATERWVDEAAIGRAPGGPLLLALGGLDPAFDALLASLRVHHLDGGWSAARSIHSGAEGDRFRAPAFIAAGDVVDLLWLRTSDVTGASEAWASAPLGSPAEPRLLDPRAVLLRHAGSGLDSAYALTLHADPVLGVQQLRAYRREADGYRLVGSIPYPFQGPFAAVTTETGELFVIGPEAVMHPVTPFVRSLVIRLNPCA